MASTLRDLLIQRAARLQDRPALWAADWGSLDHRQWRNRVEGVALGLLAGPCPPALHSATGTPWDWAAEVACAASGLFWAPGGSPVPEAALGGARFNAEAGRGPYHDRERLVAPDTPFQAGLSHGEALARLRRLNGRLGWDHDTRVDLPRAGLASAPVRAALWSALYAGAQAVLVEPDPARRPPPGPAEPWDPAWFEGFWA